MTDNPKPPSGKNKRMLPPKPKRKTASTPAAPTMMFRAGGLLGALKIWQKLVLIVLAFTVPLVVLLGNYVRNTNQSILLTLKEDKGARYLTVLSTLQNQIQMHRFLLVLKLRGDNSLEAKRLELEKQIDQNLKQLAQEDTANKNTLKTEKEAQLLTEAWNTLRSESVNYTAEQSLLAHKSILEGYVRPLFQKVRDASGLILDPNIDIYYMMSVGVLRLPEFSEDFDLMQFRILDILSGRVSEQSKIRLASERELVMRGLTAMQADLDNVFAVSEDSAHGVGPVSEAYTGLVSDLTSTTVDNILSSSSNGISRQEFIKNTVDTLSAQAQLNTVVFQSLDKMLENRREYLQQEQLVTLSLISLVFAFILALVAAIANRILLPVSALSRASDRLSRGDLKVYVPIESSDELGSLTRTFNETIDQLRIKAENDAEQLRQNQLLQQNISEFLNVAMDVAQGDLTKRGRVTEDVLGNVVDAVNLTLEEIAYLLGQVQEASLQVKSSAGEVTNTNSSILVGAKNQADAAGEASRKVVGVTESIRAMSENAMDSAQAAQHTLEASSKGQEALQNTLSGMQAIRSEVQSISKAIKGLSDRSLEISEVVDTISLIAKQTNLLALNAAIEAAGAGEAGARFAVVADQVRKLAEDSAKSATRVSGLVKSIQSEVQSVVVSVEGGTREVEQGYRIANEAGDRLKEIAELANQSAHLAEVISGAAKEQVQSIEQVGQAVQGIAQTAVETENQSQRGQETAEELRQLSQQLSENLSRFRLPV